MTGHHKDGVYVWLKQHLTITPTYVSTFTSTTSSASLLSLWHSRLGHPLVKIFSQQLSLLGISFTHSQLSNFFLVIRVILIKATN